MSSKKNESSSGKKKFPFFSSSGKTKGQIPLATSPSKDNTVKIPAMEAPGMVEVISTAVRTYSKKGQKNKTGKSKTKLKAEPNVVDPSPAKPKNLAKLFTKYGDREIPTHVRQHVPPKLVPAQSQPSATVTEADLKSVSDKHFSESTVAVDPADTVRAAVKIQALIRGFLTRTRKRIAAATAERKTPSNTEEAVTAEEEPEKSAESDGSDEDDGEKE